MRPPDAEALISEESFEHEEFLPYWAELWSSARGAGARRVAPLAAREAARSSSAAGSACRASPPRCAGGRVLATDWSPDAVRATAANAERNGVEIETLGCSWAEPDAIVERAPWPLVLASDVLYERRNVEQLLDLLPRLWTRPASCCWPTRAASPAERFLARRAGAGLDGAQHREPARAARAHPPPAADRRLDDGEVVAAAVADLVGGLEGGLEKRGGTALAGGAAGRADARHDGEAARPDRALGHVEDALGDAQRRWCSSCNAGADGGEPLLVELADEVERPQRRGDVPAELAEHDARGRAAAVLHDPLQAVDPDHDHAAVPEPAG